MESQQNQSQIDKLFAEYMVSAAEGLNDRETFDRLFYEYKRSFQEKASSLNDAQKKIIWVSYKKNIVESGITGVVCIPKIPEEILEEPKKPEAITLESLIAVHESAKGNAKLDSNREAAFALDLCKKMNPTAVNDALYTAASYGLSILPEMKQGDIMQRGPIVRFEPRYQGLIDVSINEGIVSQVRFSVIKERDEISVEAGTEPKIYHKKAIQSPGSIIGAYAILYLFDGTQKHELLDSDDIAKFKNKFGRNGVWKDWEDQMLIKSAIKRAFKGLQSSFRLNSIIEADNATMREQEAKNEKQTAENTL